MSSAPVRVVFRKSMKKVVSRSASATQLQSPILAHTSDVLCPSWQVRAAAYTCPNYFDCLLACEVDWRPNRLTKYLEDLRVVDAVRKPDWLRLILLGICLRALSCRRHSVTSPLGPMVFM